jgi:two-component system nitrate/nitrite response regulator NarL
MQAIEARLKLKDIQEQSEMNRKLFDKESLSDEDLKKLTKSEQRIIKLIAEGKTSQEIADILFISPKTVEVHRYNITKKLKLYGNNALLRFVLKSSTE